ncbi:hypothetical protein H4217_001772 [Coemansia sp. RSA 1939]|nr:hypothetical protein H4217_001772 [Coemansia sp. RSA 1939]KAJ2615357.1 hypothetical protein EV177_001612 [Coemansia sp. RSA 1804]
MIPILALAITLVILVSAYMLDATTLFGTHIPTTNPHLSKRQDDNTALPTESMEQASELMAAIPEYVQVSPDFVAYAPSSPYGLSGDALNNMVCLVNRFRYDNNQPALALHPKLIQYAQQRAQDLADTSAMVADNKIIADNDTELTLATGDVAFNATVWKDIKENLLQTGNNPTFAYWEFQSSSESSANLLDAEFAYFGAGYYNGYYVQAVGAPAETTSVASADSSLFPWCPANESFWNWAFPNGASDTHSKMADIAGQAFPYNAFASAPQFFSPYKAGEPSGMQTGYNYYFLKVDASIPFIDSLQPTETIVAANDSSTPYEAVSNNGRVQGITKEELNLLACLVNARRQEACLAPVALHPDLISAAQAHSYEMNRAQNMTHYGPSGPLSMRVKRRSFEYSTIAENIVYNTFDVFTAHSLFCNSQLHLNNMLNPDARFVGGGRSGQFWTVTFGAFLDDEKNPDVGTLPLCPGNNDTDISIAFPSGLPEETKIQTTACGNTEASPLPTPPYLENHKDEQGTDNDGYTISDNNNGDEIENKSNDNELGSSTTDTASSHSSGSSEDDDDESSSVITNVVTIHPAMTSKCRIVTPTPSTITTSNALFIFGNKIVASRADQQQSGYDGDNELESSKTKGKKEKTGKNESTSISINEKAEEEVVEAKHHHDNYNNDSDDDDEEDDDDDNDDDERKTSSKDGTNECKGKKEGSKCSSSSSHATKTKTSKQHSESSHPTPTPTQTQADAESRRWFSTTLHDTGEPNYPAAYTDCGDDNNDSDGDGRSENETEHEASSFVSYAPLDRVTVSVTTTQTVVYMLDDNARLDLDELESEYDFSIVINPYKH